MKRFLSTYFFYLCLCCTGLLLLLQACSGNKPVEEKEKKELACAAFSIQNIVPIANYQPDSTAHKIIYLDYDHAMDGFRVPTVRQTAGGEFTFRFELKNNTSATEKLFYKIYYQNESYKFPEFDSLTKKEHEFAEENFYGSWENTGTGFKEIPAVPADNAYHKIEGTISIVGNPRNEERYIQNGENNRWERNPRVGNYSFLLVVCTGKDLSAIPEHIKYISKKSEDHFVNPYYYYLYGDGKNLSNSIAAKAPMQLKVVAKPDLGKGIYIDEGRSADRTSYCATCGKDTNLYNIAPVQQFMNYVDSSTKMDNIPVIADVLKDNYSQMDYNWNKSFYKKNELIPIVVQTSKTPCKTVVSNPKEKKIIIKNPGTKFGEWKKESVGITTRHGFTYGKYRVKVKMTELLNKNGVWNGITNAIWLLTQQQAEWNSRRNCSKDGYMATYWGGAGDKRVPVVGYSEIDFEILKTPPYCPENVFPPVYKNAQMNSKNVCAWNVSLPEDVAGNNNDKITVACTNWDMACHEPKNFSVDCNEIQHNGQSFYTHRWDSNYRALTEKKEESDDELFRSDYFYFEIDWQPTQITWRIGKELNNMRVVGYMNDAVTSIPNNQMLLVITQEYHNTSWWPGAPYAQDKIPFPLNDITGQIFDLTIE
ncbi:MAG: hypothetical protein JWP12_2392 [Bacteroidetes bacterium]|nr:hypothetical protein [Bacteroidota bacterium]